MRLAAYLSTSRHGIFYFRWPIPPSLHPEQKRRDIKVSLGTRCPRSARQVSRLLGIAGHSMLTAPTVRRMRYDDIRKHVQEHFRELLAQFKDEVAEGGPMDGMRLEALVNAQGLAEGDPEGWAALISALTALTGS